MSAFEALYPGRCVDCGEDITVGQLIERVAQGGSYVHQSCAVDQAPSPFDLKPSEVVCTSCFIVSPCPCRDGV